MIARQIAVLLLFGSSALSGTDGIRSVDIKNISYPCDEPLDGIAHPMEWLVETPRKLVRLKEGFHSYAEPGLEEPTPPYIEFRNVAYGDLDGDGGEEAAVDLLYSTGGTAHWHYLYVYRFADDEPKLVGTLISGSRAYGGLTGTRFRGGLLVLEFADENRATADCCSEGYVRVSYKLVRGKFVGTGPREFGDYLRRPQ